MQIQYIENELTVSDFLQLRKDMNFVPEPREQIELALKNGLYTITAKRDDKIIGMGRLVGDGAMYCYIQDVAVLPEYQNNGIGKATVSKLIEYAYRIGLPNTGITMGLFSANGKEGFYEKLGFISQPSNSLGAGMIRDIDILSEK